MYNWNYVGRKDKFVEVESSRILVTDGKNDIRITDKDGEKNACKNDQDGEKDVGKIDKGGEKDICKMLAPLNDVWSPEKRKEIHIESTPIL